MLTSETKRRIDTCRDLLVGKLPLPSDQVELITLTLIYKFMNDLDEESVAMGGKRSFFTSSLAKYRWRALLPQTISAEDRVTLFSEGLEAIGNATTGAHLPELFRDIFRNAFLKFRDGRILTLFLTEINGFAYSHSEELGNAFEYLLATMGAQADAGQFRTPRHIIDWIVACLDPQPTDTILDPACGTGGFLVSAYRHILAQNTSPDSKLPGDLLGHEQRQQLYANFTGYDITDLMVKLAKVNLFLHQFPSPEIHIYDTLSNDARWGEKSDLILANPPFMTPKGGVTPHTKFRVPSKKAEVLFTDYIAEHLTPDGRAGIIVPNGIVATTQNAYVKLRRFLVEDSLVAVVSLPSGVFKPYSGVKTSILFLDKKLARRTNEILFLKIAADGFDLGDKRRTIIEDDLPLAKRYIDRWFKGQLGEEPPDEIPFKRVVKRELLDHAAVSLQAEIFFEDLSIKANRSETVSLSEIATFGGGGTPSKSNAAFWKGDIPWVSPKDMKSLVLTDTKDHVSEAAIAGSSTKLLPTGSVLCVVRSGILKHTLPVAITARPMCTNQDILAITPDESRLDPKFLLFVLKCRSAEILRDGIKSGVTVESFHNGFFKTLHIPLPSLEEQRRIVTEIEGFQQIIDGARQIVDAYRPHIDTHADWPVVGLSEVILGKPKNGYSGKPVAHETALRVLSLSATTSGRLDATKFKYLDEPIASDAACRCQHGDIYLQRGNTAELVGTAALFDINDPGFIYPDLMIRVRADESKILTKFLLHTLQSQPVRAFLRSQAGGAAGNMPKINQGIVERVPIPLPPLAEQERIVAELDAEAARMEAVRGLIPVFEAKIQRCLDRVWGEKPGTDS